jgi:hypothetical protein
MSETADLNDSTESLFTVFRGRLFQFRIVCRKKDCCLSCKHVGDTVKPVLGGHSWGMSKVTSQER